MASLPPAAPEHHHSERLTLRRLVPADAPALFRVTGDPEVMRYWAPGPDANVADAARRVREIEQHWQTHSFGDWGIEERATGELIGFSGLHYIIGMPEVNVGYALRRDRWGRGYGTEVCRIAIDIAFTSLGLPEIVAVIAPENTASQRLAERCGLTSWKASDWLGHPRVIYGMTSAQYAPRVAAVATAGAYVVWRGLYVFVVGFPGDATDRLGIARLGGHLEPGESAWDCAAREVREESVLRIRPLPVPATYWIGPQQDERSMVTAPWWENDQSGTAPLLVGWRPHPDDASQRHLAFTYLAEGHGTPAPAAETQGLLLLRPDDVRAVVQERHTLASLLDHGAEAILRTPLPTDLPLEPLTQLRLLAILLDRHSQLAAYSQ